MEHKRKEESQQEARKRYKKKTRGKKAKKEKVLYIKGIYTKLTYSYCRLIIEWHFRANRAKRNSLTRNSLFRVEENTFYTFYTLRNVYKSLKKKEWRVGIAFQLDDPRSSKLFLCVILNFLFLEFWKNWVFATKSDFVTRKSLQPDVVDF